MSPQRSSPLPPAPLHLPRLARSMVGQWVQLPGSAVRVLALELTGRVQDSQPGYLMCLTGEAVVDLPTGAFVRLRAGETVLLGEGGWYALATAAEVGGAEVVLLHWLEE